MKTLIRTAVVLAVGLTVAGCETAGYTPSPAYAYAAPPPAYYYPYYPPGYAYAPYPYYGPTGYSSFSFSFGGGGRRHHHHHWR